MAGIFSTHKLLTLAAIIAVGLSTVSAFGATTYDANAAFLASETPNGSESNPFGPFTAGQTAGLLGAFSPIGNHTDAFNGVANVEGYFIPSAALIPAVLVNTSGGNQGTNFGVVFEPSQILLHPDATNYGALRFTAPVAGNYAISGYFEKMNFQGNGEDVHILVNGVPIFDEILVPGAANENVHHPFNLPLVPLAVGGTVDFTVGPNGGGDFGSDSVGFAATLTVPEPGSVVLLGLGAVGLFVGARRRRGA